MDKKSYEGIVDISDQEHEKISNAKLATVFTKKEKQIMIIAGLATLFALINFGYREISFVLDLVLLMIGAFIAFIYVFYQKSKRLKAYKLLIKEIVIQKMFEKNFDAVKYYPNQGFDEKFIFSLEMFESGNQYSSNDLMSGSYKGVGFMQADVHIQDVRKSGKTTVVVELFQGRWIIFDFFKEFNGEHQVRKNHSIFKNKKPANFFGRKLKKVSFEDSEFSKTYSTYTSDEQEAFYLMTPRLMQNMLDYQNLTQGEIVFGFKDKKLHIAINDNTNAFELSGKDITKMFLKQVQNDIDVIKYVIDELNLDNDLYSK
ncbi:MAG: DUF3137 domain-containing protein [Erysipelothrix sp.]|nr:DUF3137 domain-containing protein [Erysipelothrix sp.]